MGIQYLYGPPLHVPPQMTETNEIDIGVVRTVTQEELLKAICKVFLCICTLHVFVYQPDACRTNFDAVSMIRGELFFFKSQYVWRIHDWQLQPGYPALASRHWRGIPDHVDAVYEDKSGNMWFFQGWSQYRCKPDNLIFQRICVYCVSRYNNTNS